MAKIQGHSRPFEKFQAYSRPAGDPDYTHTKYQPTSHSESDEKCWLLRSSSPSIRYAVQSKSSSTPENWKHGIKNMHI